MRRWIVTPPGARPGTPPRTPDEQGDLEAFERVLQARVRAQFFEAWKRIFLLRWLRRSGLPSSLAIQDQFDLTDD